MRNFILAIEYYHRELAVWEEIEQADPRRLTAAKIGLGNCLTQLSRFEEAEHILLKSFAELDSEDEAMSELARSTLEQIVELYLAWNRPKKAEHYRAFCCHKKEDTYYLFPTETEKGPAGHHNPALSAMRQMIL